MNRRQWLSRLVRIMLLMLVLGFFLVLLSSLRGGYNATSDTATKQGANNDLFSQVAAGQTKMQRYQGRRVWVTRLDQALRDQLEALNPELSQIRQGCSLQSKFCLVDASTNTSGVELVFSLASPAQLRSGRVWLGGFINPTNGQLYDRLGRAYTNPKKEPSAPLKFQAILAE